MGSPVNHGLGSVPDLDGRDDGHIDIGVGADIGAEHGCSRWSRPVVVAQTTGIFRIGSVLPFQNVRRAVEQNWARDTGLTYYSASSELARPWSRPAHRLTTERRQEEPLKLPSRSPPGGASIRVS